VASKTSLIGLLLAVALNPSSLPAQHSGCTKRSIAVGVVDQAWNLVPKLSVADFRGTVRGHDVQILSAAVDSSPRRIVALLDVSGSMISGSGWRAEKSISEYLLRFAPPQASVAQMTFGERILDAVGFEQDGPELLRLQSLLFKACEQGHHGGRTALYDAIASARSALGMPKAGDVIFALTDGGDNHSHIDEYKVKDDLLSVGVRLFAAIIVTQQLSGRARSPEETEGPVHLRDIVEATGGNGLDVPYAGAERPFNQMHAKNSADAVNLALQRLFQQMGEFYRLEVVLPETVQKPMKWKLEVVDAGGRPMRGVEVHCPQELMPCAKASR